MTKQRYKTLRPIMDAWADGAEIQYRLKNSDGWIEFTEDEEIAWSDGCEYRIKPEPTEIWAVIRNNNYVVGSCVTREQAERLAFNYPHGTCRVARFVEVME